MLEFKVRKVCCLHSGHVLLFGSVQRVPIVYFNCNGPLDVAIGCGDDGSVESQLSQSLYLPIETLESQLCIELN